MNGNLKWIAIAVGLIVTALTTMNAMGVFQGEIKRDVVHNHEAIQSMLPVVEQNKEHRIKFEERVRTMAESIEEIKTSVVK